jgi:predicted small secreted protein
MGRFSLVLSILLASASLLAACRRGQAGLPEDTEKCMGDAPVCHEPTTTDGCCAAEPRAAECGPKDAPLGTHLKWVCPGKLVVATDCRGIGAACVARPILQHNDSSGAPHAAVSLEVFNPDAGPRTDDGGADAGKKPARRR